MIITFLGKQFFKISQGDLTVAFNPISKDSKLSSTVSKFGSDIALSTINHKDYNGFEMVSHGESVPFMVSGPGDYEIKDVYIKGVLSEVILEGNKYINTIYSVIIENISICFLGAISDEKLSASAREQIAQPDILFVPIGNNDLLDPARAYKLATTFEPKIIIPMDYDDKTLKLFLKEAGQDNAETVDKLVIKAKDLAGKENKILILKK